MYLILIEMASVQTIWVPELADMRDESYHQEDNQL